MPHPDVVNFASFDTVPMTDSRVGQIMCMSYAHAQMGLDSLKLYVDTATLYDKCLAASPHLWKFVMRVDRVLDCGREFTEWPEHEVCTLIRRFAQATPCL